MKFITLINATDSGGGAANACRRLAEALFIENKNIRFLAQKQKGAKNIFIEYLIKNKFDRIIYFIRHVLNNKFKSKYSGNKSNFSVNFWGARLRNHSIIKNSEIIHLHWINDSFITPDEIKKIASEGKKIVWTLHDMWPFTGGCHYSGECEKFKIHCGSCPILESQEEIDLSRKILTDKIENFSSIQLNIITPSKWLEKLAKESTLFKNFPIITIPNAIDTNLFKPDDNNILRKKLLISPEKKLILFGAVEALTYDRKGFKYLLDSLFFINESNKKLNNDLELIVFGSNKILELDLPFKVHFLGTLKTDTDLIEAYNSANVFVTPSLEDNLPLTVMEAMACGIPVVGFDTGGIPEMIEHKINGYIAKSRSAEDLANGISWVLEDSHRYDDLQKNARKKVRECYSYSIIAEKHFKLYNELGLSTRY